MNAVATSSLPTVAPPPDRPGLWWREAGGAVADLGVLVPIAVALIVVNGLSATAVLLPAGLLYLLIARVYRLPVAAQPLKAFGAVAIAAGAGSDVIAAGALLMGAIFLLLGTGNVLTHVAAQFPTPVVRGVQLSVGILFGKVAWGLITAPPPSFHTQLPQPWLPLAAVALFAMLLWLRGRVALIVIGAAGVIATALLLAQGQSLHWGPSGVAVGLPSLAAFGTAFTLLVIPQLPLTFANSCVAPADTARVYFGDTAAVVTPSRLSRTLGAANVLAGAISGMPVCHGAGGMSAHYAFGARTWRAPLLMGGALVVTAAMFGGVVAQVLPLFPVAVLAALLAVAAVVHIGLLKDLRGSASWLIATVVGLVGAFGNLGWGVLLGLALSGAAWAVRRLFHRGAEHPASRVNSSDPTGRQDEIPPTSSEPPVALESAPNGSPFAQSHDSSVGKV